MKRIVIGILGIVGIGIAYWLISPFFITKEVNESIAQIPSEEQAVPNIVREGSFVGLAGHSAQGAAKVLKSGEKYYVRLDTGFQVTNGPDLFVYFGKDGEYAPEAQLGTLKGNVGDQNYEVPAGLNPDEYNEVWIWCRAFHVPFGKAVLHFE